MKSHLKSAFGIVAAVMVLFAVIAVVVVRNTSDLMVDEARMRVQSIAKSTTTEIDRLMTGVETAVANQRWVVEEKLADPDYMYKVTHELVENNASIVGSTVAFRSKYYPDRGHFFAPYTCEDGMGGYKDFQLGTEKNDYFTQGWYTVPMKTRRPAWSEPYYDEGGGQVWMSTYSVPIRDGRMELCAIFTADLSLQHLTETVKAICPIPNSYAVMRTASGAVLVRPPRDRKPGNGNGKTITISEQAKNGWTVEIVCPLEEVLRGSRQMMMRIGVFSGVGLCLIFLVAWFYSSRLQRSAALRERMAGELNTARNIQSDFLPKNFPANVHAVLRPAREVGGDLYDFVRKDGKISFIIGDASGKGVPAALYAFMAGTIFRMACSMGLNAGEIVGRINQVLAHNNEMSMFVTVFVGVLDMATGELEFGCAGHNPPVVISPDGKAQFLPVRRSPPTGAVAGKFFELQKAKLETGSRILVYTDGVTEAERADHGQYGESRLLEYAATCASGSVRDVTTGLLSSVDAFVAGAEQSDDITILAVGV